MEPITRIESKTFVLSQENIDTDQIIPARFLTTTNRLELGVSCFYDWRYDGDGARVDHPLNSHSIPDHQVLVAGDNFGCGSSREHAPWALYDLGFRVVISTAIADIFRSNALKNGLLPICVSEEVLTSMMEKPYTDIVVDLEQNVIHFEGDDIAFEIEPFARCCLLAGHDTLDVLLSALPKIESFESAKA